jgi:hypothetical protein
MIVAVPTAITSAVRSRHGSPSRHRAGTSLAFTLVW